MPWFFDPLLKHLVRSSEQELVAQIQFLKAENRMLRARLPKSVTLTRAERQRLMRLGRRIRWSVLKEIITVVHVGTFTRWIREARRGVPWPPRKKVGRPPTPEHIRAIVIRIAREAGLGYTRIQGELNKLGIDLSRSTITNILRGAGMSPDPQRGEGRWDEFLRMHAETLWACDFLSVRAWTMRGLKQFYLMLFIHVGSRVIHVSPATLHPTDGWVRQQARNFCLISDDSEHPAKLVLRDRDRKFQAPFDATLRAHGIETVVLPRNSPNLNAVCERAIRSLKSECLGHFVILGERHLNYLVQQYTEFYNTCRPHSARGRLPPARACRDVAPMPPPGECELACDARLGGLLRHYSWKRAA